MIKFSNPLAPVPAGSALPIKIEPRRRGLPRARRGRRRPGQHERARARPEHPLHDHDRRRARRRFGQKLAGEHVATFGTGDGTPRLDVETGAWVVESSRAGLRGLGAQPHQARGRRGRGPRGEAGRAGGPAQLVGRGARRPDEDRPARDARDDPDRRRSRTSGRRSRSSRPSCCAASRTVRPPPPLGFYYVALRAPEEPHARSRYGEPVAKDAPPPRASCCSTSPTWA